MADDPYPYAKGYWEPVTGYVGNMPATIGWQWVQGDPPPNAFGTDPKTYPNGQPNPDYYDPPQKDVAAPALAQVWTTAPDIPGSMVNLKDGSGAGGGASAPPQHGLFTVSPGSIRDAENDLLGKTSAAIGSYDNLKSYVASTKDFIFMKTDAGNSSTLHRGMNDAMAAMQDTMLKSAADSIELVGQFVAALNDAAQTYARADMNSFLPSPD